MTFYSTIIVRFDHESSSIYKKRKRRNLQSTSPFRTRTMRTKNFEIV